MAYGRSKTPKTTWKAGVWELEDSGFTLMVLTPFLLLENSIKDIPRGGNLRLDMDLMPRWNAISPANVGS